MQMSVSGKTSSTRLVGALVVIVIGAGFLWWWFAKEPAAPATNQSGITNTTPTPTTASDLAALWQRRGSSNLRASFKYPPGMTACDTTAGTFEFRNDPCGSSTVATFTFRTNDNWKSLDLPAAFDDAFAQELREAGLAGIGDAASPVDGPAVTGLNYKFSEALSGAVIVSKTASNTRKVSLTVRRDILPKITGVQSSLDEIISALLTDATISASLPQ